MSEATKKCKYCQTDIPVKAKICPNCKKDLRSRAEKHPFLTLILIILLLRIVFNSWSDNNNYNNTQNSTNNITKQNNIKNTWDNLKQNNKLITPELKLSLMEGIIKEWQKWWYKFPNKLDKSLYIDTTIYHLNTMKSMVNNLKDCNIYTGSLVKKCNKLQLQAKRLFPIVFPYLRIKYSEWLSNKLWDYNVNVYTNGKYKDNLWFVGWYYASNKNKKETMKQLRNQLLLLRFSKISFKWYKLDDEPFSFKLKSKLDKEFNF